MASELPQAVVVRVTDAAAVAVPNQLVNFVVVSGGGSVFAGAAQTNALGEARERWTLGTIAGEQVLEARAVDQTTGDPIVFARVTATAEPGAPRSLTVSETEHRMFLGESLDLASLVSGVADQFGNPIEGAVFRVSAPVPFKVDGTVISSATEFADDVAIYTGDASATLRLTVIRNLAELVGASGDWSCDVNERRSLGDDEFDVLIDRWEGAVVVDSVSYPAMSGDQVVGEVGLWTTGIYTFTRADGSTRAFSGLKDQMVVTFQEAGRFFLEGGGPHFEGRGTDSWARLTSENPLTYVGGPHCRGWFTMSGFSPITIRK